MQIEWALVANLGVLVLNLLVLRFQTRTLEMANEMHRSIRAHLDEVARKRAW